MFFGSLWGLPKEGEAFQTMYMYIYRYDWMYCLIRLPIGGEVRVLTTWECSMKWWGGFSFVLPVKFHNPHLGFSFWNEYILSLGNRSYGVVFSDFLISQLVCVSVCFLGRFPWKVTFSFFREQVFRFWCLSPVLGSLGSRPSFMDLVFRVAIGKMKLFKNPHPEKNEYLVIRW